MSSLPFKFQVLRSGHFNFGDIEYTADQVVERLEGHLTEGRKARIDQVLNHRTYAVATVAEHLYDIGNISAVMRSAESFGFMPFHIIERAGAKYKMSDRISRGSEKWLDIHREMDTKDCFQKLKKNGYKIYATDLHATTPIEEIDFTEKVAIVFGNEKDGISEAAREHSDKRFIWPMRGFAQSFNISVAAALCFSHIHRARMDKFGKSGDLTCEEMQMLRAQYYVRTLDSAEALLARGTRINQV